MQLFAKPCAKTGTEQRVNIQVSAQHIASQIPAQKLAGKATANVMSAKYGTS